MENFVLYDEIGKVNDQIIYKARRKGTIKYLSISCAERKLRSFVSNHVRFVHVLKHPNVVQFYEWYETSNHLWLVMELCIGGSLEQVIKEEGFLPENVVRKFGADVIRGLEYIHSRGVLFDEMKPSRFLLDGHGNVKLFDFSYAHVENESLEDVLHRFSEEDEVDHGHTLEYRNTSVFTAPETLKSGLVSVLSDYWGLGCLLYYMCCGYLPFGGSTSSEWTERVLTQELTLPEPPGKSVSSSFLSLLISLLHKSPAKRITSTQLIGHEFWQGCLHDLRTSSLTTEPVPTDEAPSLSNKPVLHTELVSASPAQNSTKLSIELGLSTNDVNNEPTEITHTVGLGDTASIRLNPEISGIPSETATFTLHATSGTVTSLVESALDSYRTPADGEFDGDSGRCLPRLEPQTRMAQSEYQQMRTISDDGPVDPSTNDTDFKFAPHPICTDTRSNLTMVFPWGDDAPTLPKEPKLLLTMWQYLRGNQSDLSSSEQQLFIRSIESPPSWRPRPLNDYSRWVRAIPPSKVDGISHPLTNATLRMATPDQLETHLEQLVNIFISSSDAQETSSAKSYKLTPFRSPSRSSRSSLLSYLIWFLASSTSSIGRASVVGFLHQSYLRLIGNTSIPKLLAEITRQLRSFSSLASDVTVGLCQLCGLLMHRVGSAVVQRLNDSSSPHEESLSPFISQISRCLASLIDVLREPPSRTGARLRHSAVIALGELLVCSVCLLRLDTLNAESSGIRNGVQTELQSSQWQTAVHHLLRCLMGASDAPVVSTTDASSGLSAFDRVAVESINRGQSRNADGSYGSRDGATGKVTDLHVRLCASRSMDAFVTAMLGCGLHNLFLTQITTPPCVHAVTTPEVVSHLWSDGLLDASSGHPDAPTAIRNQLHYEIGLSCANALAGIVFLNPGLFTSGLIDRIGIAAFVALLEPPLGGMACQQTATVARLLSIAATGLLVPLSNRMQHSRGDISGRRTSEPHGSVPSKRQMSSPANNPVGAGTPAACRRILSDPRFFVTLFRHLKSPHPMIRAKVYLLCSAVLSICPKESVSAAFDAQLAAFLERDSKSTNAVQNRYLKVQSTKSITMFATDLSDSSCVLYLAATSRYLSDLLATYVVPLICQQLLIALGCISPANSRTQTKVNARRTSRTNWLIGHGPRSGSVMSDFNTSLSSSAVCVPNMVAARAWLPAFNCLPGLLNTCPAIRLRLLMPTRDPLDEKEKPPEFCLLSVLGKLLDLWASVDPISSTVTVADVHQSGSVKSNLLGITLTITEDLSQHSDLVETRRRDLVCLVLPGLARLAVAPKARPETRAICVKIVAKLAETLLADSVYVASTRSLVDLKRPVHSARPLSMYGTRRASTGQRPLSADVDLLLQQYGTTTKSSDRIHSVSELSQTPSEDLLVQSCYIPSDFNAGTPPPPGIPDMSTSRPRRPDRKPMAATLGSAVQPPTSDVLMSLFEVVNRLMIPYAELLVQCPEVTAPTAFIRLLNLLLNAAITLLHQARVHQPTAKGDCTSDFSEPFLLTAARNLVLSLESHGLNVILVRLLASQLLVPAGLGHLAGTAGTTKPHGSVTSSLCLSLFQLFPLLLRWPKEVRSSHLIVELRLLELVFIACLQLGDLFFPPAQNGAIETANHCDKKKHPPTNTSGPLARSSQYPTVNRPMCVPMLAGLHAMNSLLTHVANVVRVALADRAANASDGESAATTAEELLLASRPPPTLAGLLARLIGLWKPAFKAHVDPTDSAHTVVHSESPAEDDICSQLCDAALTGLMHFASLYAGEYSRSAMTPSSAASLSLGLLRLHEKAQKSQGQSRFCASSNSSAEHTSPHHSEPFHIDGMETHVQARRRIRLLLRVIRRLVSSDHVCRARLAAEAAETGVANLYRTLHFLLQKTQCGADELTATLIREIFDHIASFQDRFEVDTNGIDGRESSPLHHAQGISPSTPTMEPTAAA